MTEERTYMHVIGLGSSRAWEEGRGSFYYIEGRDRKRYLPVFTTPEAVSAYIEANFPRPEAHMDMLEGLPESHVSELTEDNYVVMPFEPRHIVEVALRMEVDYLLRDPRPGHEQEVLPVSPRARREAGFDG